MKLTFAPKHEQPEGGYLHKNHLLAYGPKHTAWNAFSGFYETDKYCVAPSHSQYKKELLR